MIGLTEAALRDPGVHIGQRAYDQYQLARGYAALGDRQPAIEALAAGRDLAAEAAEYTGPRPPWHYYRGPAHYLLEAGLVEFQLGRRSRAAPLLRAGLDGLAPELRKAEWTVPFRETLAACCPAVRT
jgi:tetratricopeptide (TPR) repeat protein